MQYIHSYTQMYVHYVIHTYIDVTIDLFNPYQLLLALPFYTLSLKHNEFVLCVEQCCMRQLALVCLLHIMYSNTYNIHDNGALITINGTMQHSAATFTHAVLTGKVATVYAHLQSPCANLWELTIWYVAHV